MPKNYPRLPRLTMPTITSPKGELRTSLAKRSSFRNFSSVPIDLQTLGEILHYAAGVVRQNDAEKNNPFRTYPSAGAKYPLEVYPLVMNGKDIENGLYHYNAETHHMRILQKSIKKEGLEAMWIEKQPWFKKAAVLLIITAVFHRTTDKYNERGAFFPYIEAGHLAQNVYLLCESLNIHCCAIGMLNEKAVIKLLDINPRIEYPIYYIAVGA